MYNRIIAIVPILFLSFTMPGGEKAAPKDAPYSVLQGDTLVIGNGLVERKFVWNGGNLMTFSLTDKAAGVEHRSLALTPDFVVTRHEGSGSGGTVTVEDIPEDLIRPSYLKTTVEYTLGALHVRREFRVYEGSPVIACDTWLKGSMSAVASEGNMNNADRKNIESREDMKSRPVTALLDQLNFAGQH